MADSRTDGAGSQRIRVLGLWFGGFLAGANALALYLHIDSGQSLIFPILGLATGILITVVLGRAVIAAAHRRPE